MTLLDVVDRLAASDLDFVIVGGLAMTVLGSVHVTMDVDICYRPDPENVRRLAAVLVEAEAYLRGVPPGLPFVPDARQLRSTPVMTLATSMGWLDVMDRVAGVGDYDGVLAASIETTIRGRSVRLLDLPGLIAAKKAAGRERDLRQLPELEALLELRRRRRP